MAFSEELADELGRLKEEEADLLHSMEQARNGKKYVYNRTTGGFQSSSWDSEAPARALREETLNQSIRLLTEEHSVKCVRRDALIKETEALNEEKKAAETAAWKAPSGSAEVTHGLAKAGMIAAMISNIHNDKILPLNQEISVECATTREAEAELAALRNQSGVVAGYTMVFNAQNNRYEWTCPQNKQVYTIGDRAARDCTLGRLLELPGGVGDWSRVQRFPDWDPKKKTFGGDNLETWIEPDEQNGNIHCYMDYVRDLWKFKVDDSAGGGQWNKVKIRSGLVEINLLSTMDELCCTVGSVFGLRQGDLRFSGTNIDHLAKTEKQRNYVIYTLYVGPCDSSEWGESAQTCNVDYQPLVENTNRGGSRTTKRNWSSRPSGRGDDTKPGWSADVYRMITNTAGTNHRSTGSHIHDEFDDVRFFTIFGGQAGNDIAVRFGSEGHDPSWENPIIMSRFRESWIIASEKNTLNNDRIKIWFKCREPFHRRYKLKLKDGSDPDLFVANPTRVFSRNIERYWGWDPLNQEPRVSKVDIAYRDKRVRGRHAPLIHQSVPDCKSLFVQRTTMFYNWIHDPRNWYWDDVAGRFCVFVFSPNMLLVDRTGGPGGKHLVQQLSLYYVDQMFPGTTPVKLKFQAEFREYKRLRAKAAEVWNELDKTYPFPETLQLEIQTAQAAQMGFPKTLCDGVTTYFNEYTKRASEQEGCTEYYSLIRRHFIAPHGMGTDGQPYSLSQAVKILSRRQCDTRRLFWRLFKAKFGYPYFAFLTESSVRDSVFHLAPEFMGPANSSSLDEGGAPRFISDWDAARESGVSFDAFFGSVYDRDSSPSRRSLPSSLGSIKFPEESPAATDEKTLEDWYWSVADVIPLLLT